MTWERMSRCILIGLSSLLLNCSNAQLDRIDPSFASAGFGSQTVAVGPLLTSPGKVRPNPVQRSLILADVEDNLRARLKRGVVLGQKDFIEKVGALRTGPAWSKTWSLNALMSSRQIAAAIHAGVDYLFILELVENDIRQRAYVGTRSETIEHEDEDGNLERTETVNYRTVNASTSRSIHARYFLFDLRSHRSVWQASGAATDSNTASTDAPGEAMAQPYPPYLPPPTELDAMASINADAIGKLPR